MTLKQVTVGSGLLQEGGVNSIALLKLFLRGRVLVDETGDPRLRTGVLARQANAVEDVSGGAGANGDVKAALLGKGCMSAFARMELESN